MKIDDVVWLTKQSIESESYGDCSVVKPFQAKICRIEGSPPVLYICKYLKDDGSVDDDSNATYYCRERDLFLNEKDAIEKYKEGLLDLIEQKNEEISAILNKLRGIQCSQRSV